MWQHTVCFVRKEMKSLGNASLVSSFVFISKHRFAQCIAFLNSSLCSRADVLRSTRMKCVVSFIWSSQLEVLPVTFGRLSSQGVRSTDHIEIHAAKCWADPWYACLFLFLFIEQVVSYCKRGTLLIRITKGAATIAINGTLGIPAMHPTY